MLTAQFAALQMLIEYGEHNVERSVGAYTYIYIYSHTHTYIHNTHTHTHTLTHTRAPESVCYRADACSHKPGFLDDLRLLLPAEYVKVKSIEKLIYASHRQLQGMSDINAKYRYIQV